MAAKARPRCSMTPDQLRTLTTALPSVGRRAIWFMVSEWVTGPPRMRLKASVKSLGFLRRRFSRSYREHPIVDRRPSKVGDAGSRSTRPNRTMSRKTRSR